ncbi:MAG: RNA polymerase sigma-70 factor [Bacteroidota bacterium]
MGINNEIIQRFKSGDEKAFDFIYNRFSRKLFNTAFYILKDEDASFEVVQDAFLKLWMKRGDIDESKSIEGYLSKIASNLAIKKLKNILKNNLFEELPDLPASSLADQVLLENEFREKVLSEIESLPPRTREIFLLSRENGYSNKEIANQLGLSLSTVNNHIYIALTKLREGLGIQGLAGCFALFLF